METIGRLKLCLQSEQNSETTKAIIHRCVFCYSACSMKAINFLLLSVLLPSIGALAVSPSVPFLKSYIITGANKGQGNALCERILSEHDDTHVFLCSRDVKRGEDAKSVLVKEIDSGMDVRERIDVIQLDVTSDASVEAAANQIRTTLATRSNNSDGSATTPLRLSGIISNAGILWGYPLPELMEVCATGVKRVLDAFVPLLDEECRHLEQEGRVVVVTSGLGPLMHQYSGEHRQRAMINQDCNWEDTILPMMNECLSTYEDTKDSTLEGRIEAFEKIAFGGGPFANTAPDFHMYGLAKMFGDAYILSISRHYPNLRVTSVDPGLVYTDLILRMPKYEGKEMDETGAQSPKQVRCSISYF